MENLVQFPNNEMSPFDQIKQRDESGNEFWYARQLMTLLDYIQWRRFEEVIERAKVSCNNSGNDSNDHFAEVGNLVNRSQGGGSVQKDYKLTRYACYLIAQNGDPKKEAIALAQTYFATKTYQAEQKFNTNKIDPLEVSKTLLEHLQTHQQILFNLIESQQTTIKRVEVTEEAIIQLQQTQSETVDAIAQIQQNQEQAEKELQKIELPEVPAQGMSDRMKISWLVRTYVKKTNSTHAEVWRQIYREFNYRYHLNVNLRAENATEKMRQTGSKKEVTKMDIVSELGMLKQLYAVAYEVLIIQQAS